MNVLIVDDSRMSRMMLTTIIKDAHPDWNIEPAEDGASALALASANSFDIFTIDFNMPGINGLELAEQLKPLFPKAKMALLTANVQDSIQAQAKTLGIDFIAKPITADKITAFVG
ncbi:MAG: response regulator [Cycloclasticus sp.]